MEIDWENIQTVLLDMDGTLLDLHFDTYFWREHLPQHYARCQRITIKAAKAELEPLFKASEGTLDWYCLDYWSRILTLDIALLKEEVAHLIAIHPNVVKFLYAVRATGKRSVLVTNAHQKSLQLKLDRTELGRHLDRIVCAHDLGMAKEESAFWSKLQLIEAFDPCRTLLIDDNEQILRSAEVYGIKHLLGIHRPDTKGPPKSDSQFPLIGDFGDIMPLSK